MRRRLLPVLAVLVLASGLPLLPAPASAATAGTAAALPLVQNEMAEPPAPVRLPAPQSGPAVALPRGAQAVLGQESTVAAPPSPAAGTVLFTPTSKTTVNADGSRTAEVYQQPVFRRDAATATATAALPGGGTSSGTSDGSGGGWSKIDLRVTAQPDVQFPLAAPDALFPVRFGATPSRLARLDLPEGPVTLSSADGTVAVPELTGLASVEHAGFAKDARLALRLGGDGLGTAVTLLSADAPTSYRFHLADPHGQLGQVRRGADGGYVFSGDLGDGVRLAIPPAFAYELDVDNPRQLPGAEAGSASLTVTPAGDGFDIVEMVDPQWLRGKSFPIVLDPTLTYVHPQAATLDCTLLNGSVSSVNHCPATRMELGFGSGTNTGGSLRRGLIFFGSTTAGSIPVGSRVNTADLRLTLLNNFHGATVPISVFEQPTPWNESATWDSNGRGLAWVGGGAPGPFQSTTSVTPTLGAYSWNVKSYVQNNVNGKGAVGGLQLKMADETGTASRVLSFGNRKSPDANTFPQLVVNYDPPAPVVAKTVAITSSVVPAAGAPLGTSTSTGAFATSQQAVRGQTVTYKVTVSAPAATTDQVFTVTDPLQDGLGDPANLLVDGKSCAELGIAGLQCAAAPLSAATGKGVRITGLPVAVGQTRTITYTSAVQGASDRACALSGNTATAANAAGPAAGTAAATASLLVCDTGLGLENWYSYAGTTSTGPQGTAQVNVGNGNLVAQQIDGAPVQGHGRLGFVLRRTYNSQDSTVLTLPGSIGAGWMLNLGEAGDTVGDGVGATALSVPALTSVANPLSLTLLDRDGTRHLFTLKTPGPSDVTKAVPVVGVGVDAARTAQVGALLPDTLKLAAGYSTMCVDAPYQAPAGVHLGLFRYVQVAGSTATAPCTPGDATRPPLVAGFASVRPDRFRSEYSAQGKLLSQYDGAGNTLAYAYEGGEPAVGVALGRVVGMFDKRACGPTGLANSACRAIRVSYDDTAHTVTTTDPAGRRTLYRLDAPANPSQPGKQHLLEVKNADGTAIAYSYHGVKDDVTGATGSCGQAALGQLCSISDLRGNTTAFRYGPAPGGAGPPRVTAVIDRRGATTALDYTDGTVTRATATTGSPTASSTSAPARIKTFAGIDSHGRVGQLTDAAGADSPGGARTLRSTRYVWDRLASSSSTGPVAAVACTQQPAGVAQRLDHLLCETVREQLSTAAGAAPRQRTRATYNPDGYPLITRRANGPVDSDAATASDTTTEGLQATYYLSDGTAAVYTDTVAGGGTVTSTAPAAGRNGPTVLYSIEDRVAALSPRGNTATGPITGGCATDSTCSKWLTSWTVDAPTSGQGAAANPPNRQLTSTPCTGTAGASSSTGLVCAMTGPAYDGSRRPLTSYAYDTYGQRTTMTTPKANAEGSTASYTYTYFADSDTDLSGTVTAGGWLRAVTDPAGAFVAYAYDRSGNTVRTWDRNATAGKTVGQFTGKLAGGDPTGGRYAETLYHPGNPAQALPQPPGRYALSTRDPLGNIVATCTDEHGNALLSRPARGTRGAYPDCSTAGLLTRTGGTLTVDSSKAGPFDTVNGPAAADDKATTVLTPEQAARNRGQAQGDRKADPVDRPTRFRYNGFGDLTATTDPRGNSKVMTYDAAGRQTAVTWTRGAPSSLPAATAECFHGQTQPDGTIQPVTGLVTDSDDPLLGRGKVKCSAATSHNTLDQIIATSDAAGSVTTASYDALGRKSAVSQTRTGSVTTRTGWLFDADGNATDTCTAREFTDGAGRCSAADSPRQRRFSSHTDYDHSNRPTTTVSYRERRITGGAPATATDTGAVLLDTIASRSRYDADGNTIAQAGPQALAPDGNGQLPATAASSAQPPLSTPRYETTAAYDLLDRPGTVTTPRDGTSSYQNRTFYTPAGQVSGTSRQTGISPTGAISFTHTATSYDRNNRPVDTVTGASSPDITRTGLHSNGRDVRQRVFYDADGHVVAALPPRAFDNDEGRLASVTVTSPRLHFLTRTTYDRDGRKLAGYKPRAADGSDPSGGDLNGSPSDQCNDQVRPTPVADGAEAVPAGMPAIPTWPEGMAVCAGRLSYDPAGNIDIERSATSAVANGCSTCAEDGRFARLTYTDDDLLAAIDKPSPTGTGRTSTTLRYDGGARTTATRDPAGNIEETVYNLDGTKASAKGTPSQGIDPATGAPVTYQHVTSWTLDAAGQPTATTDGINQTARTSYYADGQVAEAIDPGGNTTRYRLDADGNTTEVLSPSGAARDATNPGGAPTRNTYTRDQLLISSTEPVTVTAAGATTVRRTDYTYDLAGRKTATGSQTLSAVPGAAYPDPAGGTDPTLRQNFAYDDNDRLIEQTGRTQTSATGTPVSSPDTIKHTLLADGQPAAISQTGAAGTNTTSFTYYADGLLRTSQDGELATDTGSRFATYEYNALGQRTQLVASNGGTLSGSGGRTRYTYNTADLLEAVHDGATGPNVAPAFTFGYDSNGRAVQQDSENGTRVRWQHNPDDTLASTTLLGRAPADGGERPTLARWAYDYDGLARIARQSLTGQTAAPNAPPPAVPAATTEQATSQPGVYPAGTYAYRYDTAGRLSSFQAGTATASTVKHDADGNRLQYGSLTYTYNADDSLASQTSSTDPTAARDYRQTTWGGQQGDECTLNTYDGFDRLIATRTGSDGGGTQTTQVANLPCTTPASTSTFTYDGLDRQTSNRSTKATTQVPANVTERVHYDGLSTSLVSQDQLGISSAVTRYVLDDQGGALGTTSDSNSDGSPEPAISPLVTDGTGTVSAVTNATGTLSCTARFDPYGSPVNTPTPDSTCNTGTASNDLWFHAGRRDASTGSYQFGSRTYTPGNATWLTPDTARTAGGAANNTLTIDPLTRNSYSYINGDPVNGSDLTGHMRDGGGGSFGPSAGPPPPPTCDKACKDTQARQAGQARRDAQAREANEAAAERRENRDRLEAIANKDCAWHAGRCQASRIKAKAQLFALDQDPMTLVHATLDVAGFLPPPAGTIASVAQAGLYLAEGNSAQAAEALLGVVPGGKLLAAAGGAAALAIGGAKIAKVASEMGTAGRVASTATRAVSAVKVGIETALGAAKKAAGKAVEAGSALKQRAVQAGAAAKQRVMSTLRAGGGETETGGEWTRVGRWMNPGELAKMSKTGSVQWNKQGVSRVANPPTPDAYRVAPEGDVYAEYDVPTDALSPHSSGTSIIYGPNSFVAKLPGRAQTADVPVRNIQTPEL